MIDGNETGHSTSERSTDEVLEENGTKKRVLDYLRENQEIDYAPGDCQVGVERLELQDEGEEFQIVVKVNPQSIDETDVEDYRIGVYPKGSEMKGLVAEKQLTQIQYNQIQAIGQLIAPTEVKE